MKIIGVVLGGGAGNRLKPLTVRRSKPAVPLAGKYRLVDVPISNCINSNIYKIYLLTQYNSASLHRHIQSAYRFDQFSKGFIRLLAAEQTPESKEWFQGTADSVRQSMHHLSSSDPDIVVVLSGDQLFRIDFQKVIQKHLQCDADITLCTTPVNKNEAVSLGILQTNNDDQITIFVEKPDNSHLTNELQSPYQEERYLASMGIYVFNFKTLKELLQLNPEADFGKHIIPQAIKTHRVFSYIFDGYWKDIGTIGSFWKANLELTGNSPLFSFYENESPIYTRPRFLPPSQIHNCTFKECLFSEGTIISAASITRSVLGLRSVIREGSMISDSIIMGNDLYEPESNISAGVPLGIGKNCRIKQAIIDKDVRIGNNVTISPFETERTTTDFYSVRDGVIVIPKGVTLPDNTVIGVFR